MLSNDGRWKKQESKIGFKLRYTIAPSTFRSLFTSLSKPQSRKSLLCDFSAQHTTENMKQLLQ